jgi:hypothetical protein
MWPFSISESQVGTEGGRRLDDIMTQEQMQAKFKTSANASDNGTVPWVTASSCKGTNYSEGGSMVQKENAITAQKKIQSANYLITPCKT